MIYFIISLIIGIIPLTKEVNHEKELQEIMENQGFTDIDMKGFDFFDNNLSQNIQSYSRYRRTGGFKAKISDDTNLMYIGKAVKIAQ